MTYQDHWIRGRLVKSGKRPCATRYQAIRDALADLPRPFYLLDLGANSGYFSFRIAETLSAFVTAVDAWPDLPTLAARNHNRRVTVIPRNLTLEELKNLGQFDAVLALSVLHHLPGWRAWLSALREMTPRLIVETPHPDENLPTAANRSELIDIVNALGENRILCESAGYDKRHKRPTVLISTGTVIPTVRETKGVVFSGSGNASKTLPKLAADLVMALGYAPYPGSLNLRVTERLELGAPCATLPGPKDFQFWRGTIAGDPCHIMQPGTRGHPHSVEIVAPGNLRSALNLSDGDAVSIALAVPDVPAFHLGICTTAWGGYEKYLPAWSESVCAQTVRPEAVTIIATLTQELRSALDAMFSRAGIVLRAVDVPKGADMGALRNLAVSETPTQWVMHLDADDLLYPWCVEECAKLQENADVISIGYTWDGVGRKRPKVRLHTHASAALALSGHLVSHSPSPFRKSLWMQRPYLTGDLVDTALWIGFAQIGARFVATARPCFIYRGHRDSHSNTITQARRRVAKAQLKRLIETGAQ